MTTRGTFAFFIERIEVGAELRVEGWAFHDRHGPCGFDVVIDGGRRPPAIHVQRGIGRRDVALARGTPMAERSGFVVVAALPPGTSAVVLRLTAGDEQEVVPLMLRTGLSLRSWEVGCEHSVPAVEHRFLTERGLRYATALPAPLARARAALGLFAETPPAVPPLTAPVSIVVPVYGGKRFLTPLVHALLETVEPRHRIVFVDDGNPDRSITAFLVGLGVSHDHVTVVAKPRNEGYLKAVIDGVETATRLNPDGHVVLLNTDVEVPAGWLERLVGPIERTPSIASTTPFTNAGTICGFPAMPEDNAPFLDAPVGEIDAAFAALAGVVPVEAPTGVGFCMALNRRALREIGFFDQAAFGRGYGEEVDWCRRAMRHGFTNVIVPNLYVHHRHGGSFPSAEKAALVEASGAVIRQRYPEFDAEVQDFIRADPLRPVRAAAAVRILGTRGAGGRPRTVLLFDHPGTGGAATFRAKEIARLQAQGLAVLLVRPTVQPVLGMPEAALDVELLHRDAASHTAVRFPANGLDDLAALVAALPLAEVVVSSLVGYADTGAVMAFVRGLRQGGGDGRGVLLRLLHHDYFPVCPSLNLIDAEDRFCGVPPLERCRACAPANPHFRWREGSAAGTESAAADSAAVPGVDVAAHRRSWQALFDLADRHVVFSRSALAVLRRAFALRDDRVRIIPHLADHVAVAPLPPAPPGPVARVAVVGGINVAKGARILEAMVRLAEAHRLPVQFELFGNIDRLLDSAHFHDNGSYEPERLPRLLAERGCHAVFLPSIWPETYCYVLDEVVGLGLPVVAFDIGAPAERLRCWSNGVLVAPTTPEAALSALLRVTGAVVRGTPGPQLAQIDG
ncbi:glycosyltransferase [Azospirillum rugosum]|uniref:GT2 family glycosyltransferase n=1 Tax=Azospirillum rugosum TaxID=416170 RepID=A0ABS4SPB5_9PROT|nr:glycosyltransferase [Azospirillum rugosum]MBP2294401.1 GT2 family glycosyltransferase [Azospirillum rugosum]MDQ0527736.1 GT2 family glycosyltransferase [Azospirillum rugosum]